MSAHGSRQRSSWYLPGIITLFLPGILTYPEIVKLLIEQFSSRPAAEKQAYLDTPNEYGNTGLHWAALGGHLEMVKLLVENGASPVLANDKEYVPLDLAAQNDKFDVVDYFLKDSEAKNKENDDGLAEGAGSLKIEVEEDDGAEEIKDSKDA